LEAIESKRKCDEVVEAFSKELKSAVESKKEANRVVKHLESLERNFLNKESTLNSKQVELDAKLEKLKSLEKLENELRQKEETLSWYKSQNEKLINSLAALKDIETDVRTKEFEIKRERVEILNERRVLDGIRQGLDRREERLRLKEESEGRNIEDLLIKVKTSDQGLKRKSDLIDKLKAEKENLKLLVKKLRAY
jgi:chromosome segregation ATPase